jgi:Flp pilus assembly protein TadD
MTTITKTQTPANGPASLPRSGFQPIPTRIRDVRDAVPPLVVEPAAGNNKDAICQSLTELGLKLAEIHRTAAEAFLSQGCHEQALPHLEAAATFSPGEIEYRTQLGVVRYLTGNDAGAIDAFRAVIAADANNVEAWFDLGMVLFGQSQHAEAEDCFRRATELQPADAQTWNNRGVCLWQLGRPADARACFQQALRIDPNDADATFNLSSLR